MRLDLGPNVEELKAELLAEIDQQAEACRLKFITGGAGQSMEYRATEAESRAIIAAVAAGETPDPANYPFVAAEAAAYTSVGSSVTFLDVAQEIAALSEQWVVVGSAIKAIRRSAKLKIELATTSAEVLNIARQIVWPTPGVS